jgi:hypothetical protein
MSEPSDPYGEPSSPVTGEVAGDQAEGALTGNRADDVTTGHPAVDAALRAVRQVAGVAPADQIPTYQAAHRTLRETLSSIDEG